MKKWIKKLEDMMAASAYAEAGEIETAKETLREQRTILLALPGPSSDNSAFRYAINACRRTGAVLEIMYSPDAKDSLRKLEPELRKEGIEHISVRITGRIQDEIQNHTENRGSILFVVIEAPSETLPGSRKAERQFEQSWNRLKCPLVTVSKPSAA